MWEAEEVWTNNTSKKNKQKKLDLHKVITGDEEA